MSPHKVGGLRGGGGWAFRVVAKNLREGKTGDGVNSAAGGVRGACDRSCWNCLKGCGALWPENLLTIQTGDRHLEAFLERGDGARGLREGGYEMAQSHGVGLAVDFTRRYGNPPQIRPHMAGENPPSGKPAADGAQGEDQTRGLPCGVGGGCGGKPVEKLENLTGPQRAVGNHIVPIDRQCTSAAYFRMPVGAKKRSARVAVS
jgi:hypothetical protein